MLSAKLKEAAGNGADATLYVDDVFSTYLYTGNGSTQTITNGIDLAGKGGMTWIKSRSAATDHKLTDTTRGATKALISDTTGAETTDTTGLTAFSSTGFSLGASSVYNTTATTYASWTFREAAKFFDVQTVTHTNGTANNIDLSVLGTVGMVIAKITSTTGDWTVWQRSLTASNNLKLNTTSAQSTTNAWLSVSSTTATLAAAAPTGTYVIYAYAHDTSSTGIIQCGSFTTDATGKGAVVTLGWEPQFILVKDINVDNATYSGWNIIDSLRGLTTGTGSTFQPSLRANASFAESSSYIAADINATGFRAGYLASTTYIYMAIRRPNKPLTSGTQVFGLNARTGNGGNTNVTGGQTDDAVLIKNRGAAVADLFSSRLTGTGYLVTPSTAAEVAAGATILQANPWDVMDGVNVGTTSTITNAAFNTYINYFFKRAPGFFDVVCWNATGTGGYLNVSHNLGAVPELIIFKPRSGTSYFNEWIVGASVLNAWSDTLVLDKAIAKSVSSGNFQPPTTSEFKVYNPSGYSNPYIAYLFATLAGISKVGSYTGNGTSQNIECGFAAGARFFLVKATSTAGSWWVWDSARGITSGNDPALQLNSTAAEITTADAVDPYSPGITVNQEATCSINASGVSYIFLAIA